jgi:hypothetical protein
MSEVIKSNFLQNDNTKALFLSLLTLIILGIMNLIVRLNLKGKEPFGRKELMVLFFSVFSVYILWSYLVTGIFMGNFRSEQPLYVLNLLAFWFFIRKAVSPFGDETLGIPAPKDRWALYFGLTIIVILLLPLMVQLMHGGVPNANIRFPIQP